MRELSDSNHITAAAAAKWRIAWEGARPEQQIVFLALHPLGSQLESFREKYIHRAGHFPAVQCNHDRKTQAKKSVARRAEKGEEKFG